MRQGCLRSVCAHLFYHHIYVINLSDLLLNMTVCVQFLIRNIDPVSG